ncbi:MAG: cob(I)yrinic acid a,c-diamide adenosyltransferase [Opitutaceae bacterium]
MDQPPRHEPTEAEHRDHMREVQAAMRAKIGAAREKRPLLIVHTGDGKGKSTAAFGLLARMLGHGRRCAVIQFIKSGEDAAERPLRGPLLDWHCAGGGFTWDTQDRAADIARCREGWAIARRCLADPAIRCLILDEMNVVLSFGYLPLEEVLPAIAARAPGQHVVLTGRGAPEKLIEAADLVTEMREIKHPFAAGVRAQAGVEF